MVALFSVSPKGQGMDTWINGWIVTAGIRQVYGDSSSDIPYDLSRYPRLSHYYSSKKMVHLFYAM